MGMNARKPTVLVADNEPLTRARIALELGDSYNILLASDGLDAARQYECCGQQVAAVITDLRVARLNGIALAGWLRHINPRLPVIIMAGGALDTDELAQQLQEQKVLLIMKPLVRHKLKALLNETIRMNREA